MNRSGTETKDGGDGVGSDKTVYNYVMFLPSR